MEPSAGLNATPTWWSLTVRWLTDFQTPKQMLPPVGGRKAFSNSVPSSCQVRSCNKKNPLVFRSPQGFGHGLAVSPDERFILYARPGKERADIMIMENYR